MSALGFANSLGIHPQTLQLRASRAEVLANNLANSDTPNCKARDFDFIIIGLVYFLNIVDASVDAHLFNFDVSDDLSLNINPNYMVYPNRKPSVGFTLTFTLTHSHNP